MKNWIQIAGVRDRAEALLLIDCGVKALGFPLRLPVHTEDLSEREAAAILKILAPPVCGVVITYLDQADEIYTFCNKLGATWVQLHGGISRSELARLKKSAPALGIIKSLVVRG
ncbi:MAG: phosphoribosylanthranilate isomerase, partial [Planctomycetes bacterium]|nr:phosphoribosylanthranilate isomerase [Planctomycetota bacterium]